MHGQDYSTSRSSVKKIFKKLVKNVSTAKAKHAYTSVLIMLTILIRIKARLVLLFDLSTSSLETVTKSIGSCLVGGFLLYNCYRVLERDCS